MKVKDMIKAQKKYERLQKEIEATQTFKKDLCSITAWDENRGDDDLYSLFCDIDEKMIPALLTDLKKQLDEMEV